MKCRCGSGQERYPLHDAAGIFVTFVCEECEEQTKRKYNPAIWDSSHRYASSGEEGDLDANWEEWD